MNIVFFSSFLFGGAGSSAKGIVSKLTSLGVNSYLLFRFGQKTEENEICTDKWYSQDQLNKAMTAGVKNMFYTTTKENSVTWENLKKVIPIKPDIFVLFWYSQFLTTELIVKLYDTYKVPIVIHMFDNAIISGGCHYTLGCDRYKRGCGTCPQLMSIMPEDISYQVLKEKKKFFKDIPLHIIAPSSWQQKLVVDSQIPYLSVQTQLLGFPLKKISSSAIHQKYNSITKFEFLWSSSYLTELRKGLPIFFDAIQDLDEHYPEYAKQIQIKIIGKDAKKIKKELKFIEFLALERLSPSEYDQEMQSSHFYINSTLEDAGPGTLMLAVNSGIIPISFPSGVAADIITAESGFLLNSFSYLDLSKAIRDAIDLSSEKLEEMALKNLEIAVNVMDEEKTFKAYIDKLTQIVHNHRFSENS
jgi:glycosyltransferase involved in cell wall biosynthesis